MTVYNQRIKFSIVVSVLLLSMLFAMWYNNKISSKLIYVKERISYLDSEIIEGSILPIKIEEAFLKYNEKKSSLDFFSNPDIDKKELKNKIKKLAKNNGVKIKEIIIKEGNSFNDLNKNARIESIPFIIENIEVNVVGNFLDIGLFLESMIQDSENLNLNKCDFDLDQEIDRQVRASIEFYTYYMEKT